MSNRVNLTLDIMKASIKNPLITVRQGDGNFETLRATVTANGEPLDLQGWTITFMGTTAGKHKIVDGNVTIVDASKGIFEYTPSKAWGMDVGGFKIAYFKFISGDGSTSSANFQVEVIEAVDLTQEEAQNYISVVDTTIAEINQHLTDSLANVTQSITETSSTASSLSVQVSSAVNQVNSAASNATSVASSAVDNVNSVASSAASYITINDAQLVHKTGTETIAGDKTFTGNNAFTGQINGALKTRPAIFTDFADVAKNMLKYAGNWYVTNETIANDPIGSTGGLRWYHVSVTPAYESDTGSIQIEVVDGTILNTGVNAGVLQGWNLIPKNSAVVHNTENETIAGDKTFTGNATLSTTTMLAGNYGLRVTASGIEKTTDGKTWVSANI